MKLLPKRHGWWDPLHSAPAITATTTKMLPVTPFCIATTTATQMKPLPWFALVSSECWLGLTVDRILPRTTAAPGIWSFRSATDPLSSLTVAGTHYTTIKSSKTITTKDWDPALVSSGSKKGTRLGGHRRKRHCGKRTHPIKIT